jgi:hypothetical protein
VNAAAVLFCIPGLAIHQQKTWIWDFSLPRKNLPSALRNPEQPERSPEMRVGKLIA